MKIYIGKYKNTWISPYVILEKFFWFRKNYDAHENRPPKWLQTICEWNVNFLDTINPRIEFVKIDKYDVWNMDHTMSMILYPMFKQLKETKQGAPHIQDEDVPDYLKSMNAPRIKDEWDVDDNFFLRWEYVLDEIIWALEQYTYDWEDQYKYGISDLIFTSSGIEQGPNHTRKYDREGMEKHQKRMTNGFRLMGVYWQGFWD